MAVGLPFDPQQVCAELRTRVLGGDLDWNTANAMWQGYLRAWKEMYPGLRIEERCCLTATCDGRADVAGPANLALPSKEIGSPFDWVDPLAMSGFDLTHGLLAQPELAGFLAPVERPPSIVASGSRPPVGSAGPYGPAAALPFQYSDILDCYPRPEWVTRRLEDYPQTPAGNGAYDPLPIPFTADEVKGALRDVCEAAYARSAQPVSWIGCSREVQPSSVHIAERALQVLSSRNTFWIRIYMFGERHTTWSKQPSGALVDVDLECQLAKLVGKPLPVPLCNRTRPSADMVYDVDRLTTTFSLQSSFQGLPHVPAPSPEHFGPGLPPPRPIVVAPPRETSKGARPCKSPREVFHDGQSAPIRTGCELEALTSPPPQSFDPYSRGSFEVVVTYGIRDSCSCSPARRAGCVCHP